MSGWRVRDHPAPPQGEGLVAPTPCPPRPAADGVRAWHALTRIAAHVIRSARPSPTTIQPAAMRGCLCRHTGASHHGGACGG
eukprot:scaffold16746_cov137-Isochrysis_galbana.AAC.3